MSLVARHLVIHGRVQGVGYRDACVRQAEARNVAGWVRNRRDGTVEAFAQGTPDDVAAFAAWCRTGPRHAGVTHVDTRDAAPDPAHAGFTWLPTA